MDYYVHFAADMDADVEIYVKANCDFYDGVDRY
jgi:hypothetical protein